jgi:UDP-N-acetylglucosamine 2-epimerase (non-hydrolysing)
VQTAEIMRRFEQVCLEQKPTHVLVVGDVNSTIACALVAVKLGITTVHVEAGLRSFDRRMPEEINRVLTDAISDILFTTEASANENLLREGVAAEKIHFVGNVMIDTLQAHRAAAAESPILHSLGLANGDGRPHAPYGVLTLHRAETVDDKAVLRRVLDALVGLSQEMPIIFPVHPRTRGRIEAFGLRDVFRWNGHGSASGSAGLTGGIIPIEPLGYLDFLRLMAEARLVLTDSGGIQEETTILKVPCVTLRDSTERPVTVTDGTNVIAGTERERIVDLARRQLQQKKADGLPPPPLWDGQAAARIANVLSREL